MENNSGAVELSRKKIKKNYKLELSFCDFAYKFIQALWNIMQGGVSLVVIKEVVRLFVNQALHGA